MAATFIAAGKITKGPTKVDGDGKVILSADDCKMRAKAAGENYRWHIDALKASLDTHTPNRARIHTGNPGVDGDSNILTGLKTATINAAVEDNGDAIRQLDEDLEFDGLTPEDDATWWSLWHED